MIWARPGSTLVQVGFKLTAPRMSPTRDRGVALHRIPIGPASRRLAVTDVQDLDHSVSLSSDYKEENVGQSFLFPVAFSPTPRWVLPSTHRRLAAVHSPPASRHLSLPLGDSSCLADPRFLALLLP
jgi:hypothetical protein